jgi:hypothetical protein
METVHAAAVALSASSLPGPQARAMKLASLLSLFLATAPVATTPPDTRVDPKAPHGAIGGRIAFPGGVTPSMRICALAGEDRHCIDVPAGRTLYRIGNLPDADYQVVARVDDAGTPVAGHVQAVQCIRAPCPAQLATLAVAGGKEIATADLNGFYAERADFPSIE